MESEVKTSRTTREAAGLDRAALNKIIKAMFIIAMNHGKPATPGRVDLVRKAAGEIQSAAPDLISTNG